MKLIQLLLGLLISLSALLALFILTTPPPTAANTLSQPIDLIKMGDVDQIDQPDRSRIVVNQTQSVICNQLLVDDTFSTDYGPGSSIPGWTVQTYGNGDRAGYQTQVTNGMLLLNSSGSSTFQSNDNLGGFLYLHQTDPLTATLGVDIQVKILDIELIGSFSKAGLEIRNTLEPDSPKLTWNVARNSNATTVPRQLMQGASRNGVGVQYIGGGLDFWRTHPVDLQQDGPIWLRLKREAGANGTFYLYYRQTDETPPNLNADVATKAAWWGEPVQSTTVSGIDETFYVGLINASYSDTITGTSQLDDFSMQPQSEFCSGFQTDIFGSTEGLPTQPYTFTAIPSFIIPTNPLTFVWQAAQQPTFTRTNKLTDTATFTWNSTGPKMITATVLGGEQPSIATHTITLQDELCRYPLTNSGFEQSYPYRWQYPGYNATLPGGVIRSQAVVHSGNYSLRAASFDNTFYTPHFYQKITLPGWIDSNLTTVKLDLAKNINSLIGQPQPGDKFYAILADTSNPNNWTALTEPIIIADGTGNPGGFDPKAWLQSELELPVIDGLNLADYRNRDAYLYFYNNSNSTLTCGGSPCYTRFYFDDITLQICSSLPPEPIPILSIGKTASAVVAAGQSLTYTLTVTNSGSVTATNLLITDTIPAGASYIAGGTQNGNLVQWNVPELAANGGVIQQSFVVTTAETVVNDSYGVQAEGGYQVSGSQAITTLVGITAPPVAGTVELTPGVTITIAPGTFSDTVVFIYHPIDPMPTAPLKHVNLFYEIEAIYVSSGLPAQPEPGQRYTISLTYQPQNIPPEIDEADLALYTWNGSQWLKEPTSTVDPTTDTVTASPSHFSQWAVLAPVADNKQRIFLPLVLK